KDFVILYRTNSQSRVIEDALRMNSIPYVIIGGVKFYQRKEIKDVLAYLKILVNRKDDEAMTRILKLREGGGETTLDRLKRYAGENALSLCDSLLKLVEDKQETVKQTRINNELTRLANLIEKYSQ